MELNELYDCDFFSSQRYERSSCLFDDFNIDQYLDLSCLDFDMGSNATFEKTPIPEFNSTSLSSNELIQEEAPKPQAQKKNKSIFHNFQKHLITLLKKHISVESTTFGDS
jgi:hypothetical protein